MLFRSLVSSSLHRMKTLLDGRPLEVEIQEGISPVDADPDMIGLALRQLLGNAVKYSPPETTIGISASQIENTVTIGVRDHGPGIPPDELNTMPYKNTDGIDEQPPFMRASYVNMRNYL